MNYNIYLLLTPLALGFILIEMVLCWYYRKEFITFQEAVSSFGCALGNQTMNVLIAVNVFSAYEWMWVNFRLIGILEMNVLTFALLLVCIDFIFYWVHRLAHSVNILWAAHSPHHSAGELNLFVALRASVTQRLISFLFLWPLTIVGFRPVDIYAMSALHIFISFLHHTETVPKLWTWIEYLFTTPSHHRVHHAVNFNYLDRNFGDFLIIWDRIFGTYAEEEEKAVYGMYNPPRSFNPIKINFHYFQILWNDAKAAPRWIDKIRIWFMPLGWRPEGLPQNPPLIEVTSQNQVRYRPAMFIYAKPYLIVHIILGLVLMMFVIDPNSPWGLTERWVGNVLLWHAIINWSGILESKRWLYNSEVLRLILTCLLLTYFFDHPIDHPGSIAYLILCLASLAWVRRFFLTEKNLSLESVRAPGATADA